MENRIFSVSLSAKMKTLKIAFLVHCGHNKLAAKVKVTPKPMHKCAKNLIHKTRTTTSFILSTEEIRQAHRFVLNYFRSIVLHICIITVISGDDMLALSLRMFSNRLSESHAYSVGLIYLYWWVSTAERKANTCTSILAIDLDYVILKNHRIPSRKKNGLQCVIDVLT